VKKQINTSKAREVRDLVKAMPYFTVESLSCLDVKEYYLKIILSRLRERGEIISLKRGIYVSGEYLNQVKSRNTWNEYMEFLCGVLYAPSYLSLEYVLNEDNILSESSFGFSMISTKKTSTIKNELGSFHYHNIKEDLFSGFKTEEKGGFLIYKATTGKALFDFLYLRKNIISDESFLSSLRINKDQISEDAFQEFKKYVEIEASKKMKKIAEFYAS
jgi:predicted transcriptional regulator of viral defense system